jgi:hypothetical protein
VEGGREGNWRVEGGEFEDGGGELEGGGRKGGEFEGGGGELEGGGRKRRQERIEVIGGEGNNLRTDEIVD